MSDEFVHEDFQEVILWDLDACRRVYSWPTGTPDHPAHRIETRMVMNPFGRTKHKGCGGIIRHNHASRWVRAGVSVAREWDECLECHRKFNEVEW